MAKTRAQRKAEQRRRRQQGAPGGSEPRAREPQVADPAERSEPKQIEAAKAKAETKAPASREPRRLARRKTREAAIPPAPAAAIPGVTPEPIQVPPPSRADRESPDDEIASPEDRKVGKQLEKEQRRKERARELQQGKTAAPAEPAARRRAGIAGFLASCVAELRRVQWPDRDALVQASAVTLLFVVAMAAYLGGLDAIFNFMLKQIL